jgi:hypothetical protein
LNISYRFYGWLLLAYPPEFRQDFGDQMLQVFRDCYRAEASNGSLTRFWLRMLLDLILTAAKERTDNSGRKGVLMSNRRTDTMAVVACVGIIVIALLLLNYGIRNQVSSILFFGFFLDALVSTGVVGNIIVFLLVKTTRINPLRAALWSFAVVHAVLLSVALVIGRSDPTFNLGGVVVGYALSLLFWTGLHWAWRARNRNQTAAEG